MTDRGDGTMTAAESPDRKEVRFVNKTEEEEKKKKKHSGESGSDTGDETPLGGLIAGLVIGAGGVSLLLWLRRRSRR